MGPKSRGKKKEEHEPVRTQWARIKSSKLRREQSSIDASHSTKREGREKCAAGVSRAEEAWVGVDWAATPGHPIGRTNGRGDLLLIWADPHLPFPSSTPSPAIKSHIQNLNRVPLTLV